MPTPLCIFQPTTVPTDSSPDTVFILKDMHDNTCTDCIGALFRQKRLFAIDCIDGLSEQALLRIAQTAQRKKMPVPILHSLRLFPPFARLKELLNSGCLGKNLSVHAIIPHDCNVLLGADLCLWLKNGWTQDDTLTANSDPIITLRLSGDNGHASASLLMKEKTGSLSVCLGDHHHAFSFQPTDAYSAEIAILKQTCPVHHRWPLLCDVSAIQHAILAIGSKKHPQDLKNQL